MKQNEEKAARIFMEYRNFVKEQTLRFAPLPGLSEDIFQEVFIEFLTHADRWDLDNDIRPILVVLVKRLSARALNAERKNRPTLFDGVIDPLRRFIEQRETKTSDRESTYESKTIALKQCLDLLPIRSRTLIDLYYFDAVPVPEIAERMSISANAIYLAVHRIRERLKKCIRRTLGWSKKNGASR